MARGARAAALVLLGLFAGTVVRDGRATGPPLGEVVAGYRAARRLHRAGRLLEALGAYRALADMLVPIGAAPPAVLPQTPGSARTERALRRYLQKTHRDLATLLLLDDLPGQPDACTRLAAALHHLRAAMQVASDGGFARLAVRDGTARALHRTTVLQQARGCRAPAPDVGPDPPTAPPSEPADGGESAGERSPPAPPGENGEPHEGFGATTAGGDGGREIRIREATEEAVRAAFEDANTGGPAVLRFEIADRIVVARSLPPLTASHLTLEGHGATLIAAPGTAPTLIDIRGRDVVVRDLRLRNGYDNLRIQGEHAADVVVSHVSSTGAVDDGISIAYGAHRVTVQWAFLAGNTRSLFLKYGATTDISIHHSWILKQWTRGPLVSSGAFADIRNVVVEDWTLWGMRFEAEARGNIVDSLFVLGPHAAASGGKATAALRLVQSGAVYAAGNVFAGLAHPADAGSATEPLPAPPVATDPVPVMAPRVRARAGCLPRDAIDRAYIEIANDWTVTEGLPLRLEPVS